MRIITTYKHTIAIFCPLLTIATISFAQNSVEKIDKYISSLSINQQFNGNVLVAEEGKVTYKKSFGYADFSNKKLNSSESKFPIASITKTFTATAILQLKEKGKLQINDPVVKFLPDFPYPTITIKHLLSHTSGLYGFDNILDSTRLKHPDTVFTNSDLLQTYVASKAPLLYQPDEDGNYNM